ncbi:MAG: RDD family protein [Spirochaetales bacterium]|nr:RDD family protein [Spirochaetales bacterium]
MPDRRESSPSIVLETPERIRFRYSLSSPGTRAAALVYDLLLQGVILAVWGIVSLLLHGGLESGFDNWEESTWFLSAFGLLLWFFLQWGYFSFFEIAMDGCTPGKKVMKILVIREDGKTLDSTSILLRNFLRAVDSFPLVYLVGGLVSLIDSKNRRLGDIIGGTVVVTNEEKKHFKPDFSLSEAELISHPDETERVRAELSFRQSYLNENQLYLIRRFFFNNKTVGETLRKEQSEKLAELVENETGVTREESEAEAYLLDIYKGHEIYENS